MTSFADLWKYLQANLKSGIEVKNWTAFKGYLGDKMSIISVIGGLIAVETPGAKNIQVINKEDFEKVWEVWSDYKS